MMHSQTTYDAMWKPHSELSPESYWLLSAFRDLDKVRNLSDEQQVKLQEVIPQQKIIEYLQSTANSARFHDRLQLDHKVSIRRPKPALKEQDPMGDLSKKPTMRGQLCNDPDTWFTHVGENSCILWSKGLCM